MVAIVMLFDLVHQQAESNQLMLFFHQAKLKKKKKIIKLKDKNPFQIITYNMSVSRKIYTR
jgi:Tfp pilus assembly protein PilP